MAVITEIEVNKKHTYIPAQQKLLNNAREAMEKN